ncbi:MAG: hypothetical protein AAF602_21740 [Myxococcota bacterium]
MYRVGTTLRSALWWGASLVAVGCGRFQAEPQPSRFEIAGAHSLLTCEACHTEGQPYGTLPTDCRSCHESDRKNAAHFPEQTCNDAGCHSSADFAWAEVGGVDGDFHDFLPLVDSHNLDCEACHTDTENYTDLPGVSSYCWNCHEVDRKGEDDTPNGLHFIAYLNNDIAQPDPAFRWDCGPCHVAQQWATSAFDHAWRSPHGVMVSDPAGVEACVVEADDTQWITGCVGCHPDTTAVAQCVSCHDDPTHFPGQQPLTCTGAGCHVSAQPPDCDSLITPLP